jgi:hypothetical protein
VVAVGQVLLAVAAVLDPHEVLVDELAQGPVDRVHRTVQPAGQQRPRRHPVPRASPKRSSSEYTRKAASEVSAWITQSPTMAKPPSSTTREPASPYSECSSRSSGSGGSGLE